MHAPLTLRAHQVLCLQGFRGEGYSKTFVAEMSAVHAALTGAPHTAVTLTTAPDRLCAACPNLSDGGCTLQGPEHEAHMRAHDLAVLERLGLESGGTYAWSEILGRIAGRVRGADLGGICTTCPWLAYGWCASAVDRLADNGRRREAAGE